MSGPLPFWLKVFSLPNAPCLRTRRILREMTDCLQSTPWHLRTYFAVIMSHCSSFWMNVYQRPNTTTTLACIASGSVRIRSKEQETRVQDRIKNGVSKREILVDKPRDFENHPLGLLCRSKHVHHHLMLSSAVIN